MATEFPSISNYSSAENSDFSLIDEQSEYATLEALTQNLAALSEPIRLIANSEVLAGNSLVKEWDETVRISALNTSESPAALTYGKHGFSTTGGRYDSQIDFDPVTGFSEQIILDFDGLVFSAEVELGQMGISEWQGLSERGAWIVYDRDGKQLQSGILDPTEGVRTRKNTYEFQIESSHAFSRLVLEALAYDDSSDSLPIDNSSDFSLRSLTYVLGEADAPTSDTGGETPSDNPTDTTSEDGVGGSTGHNIEEPTDDDGGNTSTEDPASTSDVYVLQAEKTLLDGNAPTQIWGDGVTITGFDLDGNPVPVVYDDQFDDFGYGVAGGRYDQIDFFEADGQQLSEKVEIDFGGAVTDVVMTFGQMDPDERNRVETGKWTAYDENDIQVAEGVLSPEFSTLGTFQKIPGSKKAFPLAIATSVPFNKIVIESTGFDYGTGTSFKKERQEGSYLSGPPYIEEGDFNIQEVSYRRVINDGSGEQSGDTPGEDTTPPANEDNSQTTGEDENSPVNEGGNSPVTEEDGDPTTDDAEKPTDVIPEDDSTPAEEDSPPVNNPPTDTPTPPVEDSVNLQASGDFINGSTQPQMWDEHVTISGVATNGTAAAITYNGKGLAVKGGRYDNQIDFDADSKTSEQIVLNFNTSVAEAILELDNMGSKEWNGLAETGRWTAYDADGNQVGTDILDPTSAEKVGRHHYRFDVSLPAVFNQLVIEATGYGNGIDSDRLENNSDFSLRSLTYTLAA